MEALCSYLAKQLQKHIFAEILKVVFVSFFGGFLVVVECCGPESSLPILAPTNEAHLSLNRSDQRGRSANESMKVERRERGEE